MTRSYARLTVLAITLATAIPAVAQTQATADAPQAPGRPWEFAGGVLVALPVALGSIDANLLDPRGGELPLFSTSTETGMGLGFEVDLGTAVARRVDVEMTAAWTRFEVRTAVSDDFEDVPDVTVSDTLTRFSVGGAVLWRFVDRPRVSWFARGGGAWMRELSSDASLVEDGLLIEAGVGVKYWMSTNPAGEGRFGLRAEFRALNRRRGIEIDDGSFRIWPLVTASAVVRF